MGTLEYRADIDGLRSIAVLSVLLHHLSPALVPGGYVGVDIFFVISGYLITSQIARSAGAGTFSIRAFYKNRINRILPALLVVVAATLAVGAALLSPSDFARLAASSLFSAVGLGNVYLWREYGNYFSGDAAEAPLLHTWSLGVEEQFYFIWPIVLILLFKIRRRVLLPILVAATIAAIVVSQTAVGYAASASYYLLPARFFELMIGGLLAVAIVQGYTVPARAIGLCIAVGLTLILASLFLLNPQSQFPGVNAVGPCLGSALLIWAGGTRNWCSPVLESRPAVFVGLLSYSLYLWHWPIIAYLHYRDIPIDLYVGTIVVAAAFGLAYLSWRYVEGPMRQSGRPLSFGEAFAKRFAVPVSVLSVVVALIAVTGGIPQRFDPTVAELEKMQAARPEVLREGCHVSTAQYSTPFNDACRLGTQGGELDGIMIGDSYANHFTGMVDVMAKDAGLSFADYTMDGCPPIRGYMTKKSTSYAERCRLRNEAAYQLIKDGDFRHVILAASWPRDETVGPLVAASVEAILRSGARLTIILSNQSIPEAGSCAIRRIMYQNDRQCDGVYMGNPGYMEDLSERYPDIAWIDPNQVICHSGRCNSIIDGTPLYRDDGHLNDVGSRLIGGELLQMGVTLTGLRRSAGAR